MLIVWRITKTKDGNAHKWFSVSSDGGLTFTEPQIFGYSDGTKFFSTSTFHRLFRSSKTQRLYWIGNIAPEAPTNAGHPRYPLVIAEVDEDAIALKKDTVTEIDTRHAGEGKMLKLRESVQKIKGGNFDIQADTDSSDEVGDVAAFNEMSSKLKELYYGLELKVKERTDELNIKVNEIEKQNSFLAENKSAMLNLLEDSKKLEEELKVEKESVEKKVKERTDELLNEKAKLSSAINSLPRAFAIVDSKGQIITTNGRFEEIFGKQTEEWSIELIDKLISDKLKLQQKVIEVLSKNKVYDIDDFEYDSKFIGFYIAPIIGIEQKVIGAILTIKDVTEDKVRERSKDEFFSIASHELRTPLTAIRGNTS